MKKIWMLLFLGLGLLGLSGCGNKSELGENPVLKATLNENGDIVILEDSITSTATFLNYEDDGVQIGFLVVRGTDGVVRIAFNTCQSCSPSPNAYFIQKGEYFECQNCKNKFHIDKIGIEKGGCNPAPVEEMKEENGVITISSLYAKTYRSNFENWNGPKA